MNENNGRDVSEYLKMVVDRLEWIGKFYDYTLYCDDETKEKLKDIIDNIF